ncbi:MAG TPA: hypothetical protein VGR47_04525 [Terracidiphilus sp.]|nr:hypothetical protein [Terracidiphilus sp.]
MPIWLKSDDFSLYPRQGRDLAIAHLAALRAIPTPLLPVFLVELKEYDWKFPVEQQEIVARLEFVETDPNSLAAFRSIHVPAAWEDPENVKDPQRFLAGMTATLWSSLQMDAYRKAADQFVGLYEATAKPTAPAQPRLVMTCIGRQSAVPAYPLFQKLRGSGRVWTNVRTNGATAALLNALHERAAKDPTPYSHWYIDGGSPLPEFKAAGVAQLLYPDLAPVDKEILGIMMSCIKAGSGPEVLQAKLAELTRHIASVGKVTDDARMQQFVVSLLTQGSGTQIFSTSFVQWATREILRRAQPATILARYAPRQRQKSFNALVADALNTNDIDPEGSLIDADMAAYYSYLELKRLPGADRARFLVWFEGHPEAFTAGPGIAAGTVNESQTDMAELLSRMQASN